MNPNPASPHPTGPSLSLPHRALPRLSNPSLASPFLSNPCLTAPRRADPGLLIFCFPRGDHEATERPILLRAKIQHADSRSSVVDDPAHLWFRQQRVVEFEHECDLPLIESRSVPDDAATCRLNHDRTRVNLISRDTQIEIFRGDEYASRRDLLQTGPALALRISRTRN